jgi:predicted N-acetyltransferase YhbS
MIHEENAGGRVVELLGLCPGLSRVALRDGVVVGCALASYDGFAGQLFRVVVDESLRGRGIGSSLVQECVERLRARGARRIVLGCEERLVPWYARLGFGASPARFLVRGL